MEAQPREINLPAVVPAQRRIVDWDPEGNPILKLQPVLTKQHIKSIYFIAAAQPFIPNDERSDFEKYHGMTTAEVMIRKQMETAIRSGDVASIETIMDRLIDKPLSRSENFTLGASYEDVLKEISRRAPPVAEASVFGDLV
jgi:hypothetical protein